MNPKPISETEAIRSDIEMTRRRMDDTMDALGERLHGRHLLDEIIGFFRHNSDTTSETGERVREKLSETAGKISDSASTAANAVVDTVKKNPLPVLMIAAGAAWLTYSMTRSRTADVDEDIEEGEPYDPDTHYDRPLEYPSGTIAKMGDTEEGYTDEPQSKFAQMKDTVQEKASAAKEQVKEKLSNLKDRASEIGSRVQDRTKEIYGKTRDRVAQTADEHPLEVGLGCLAVGVLVGLALPTPDPVHRVAGPTVDRLKDRTREASREFMQRGKRVVQAATSAAKQEAQTQGLTLERLRQGGRAVAERAGSAASQTANAEMAAGTAGDISSGSQSSNRAGADPADPSAARPAM